jgi:hypothetical protein
LIFSNRTHPIDPRLTRNSCLVCFHSFGFSQKTRANPTPRAVLATCGAKKVAVAFFESNTPNPPRLTQNSCVVCFPSFPFGQESSCETRPRGPFWPLVKRKKLQLIFFESNAPPFDPKLMSGVFSQFRFRSQKLVRTRPRGPFWPLVERKKLQLLFSNRKHPIHPV